MLFRYSALTFNSHRIHYDLAYVAPYTNGGGGMHKSVCAVMIVGG
jgi:hypothetical protein